MLWRVALRGSGKKNSGGKRWKLIIVEFVCVCVCVCVCVSVNVTAQLTTKAEGRDIVSRLGEELKFPWWLSYIHISKTSIKDTLRSCLLSLVERLQFCNCCDVTTTSPSLLSPVVASSVIQSTV